MKLVFVAFIVIVLGALLWGAGEATFVRQFLQPGSALPSAIRFDNDASVLPSVDDSTRASQGSRAGMRKCLRAAEVLYTDEPCPAGSKEAKLSAGAVTVVPGQSTAARPTMPQPAASRPGARDLLLPPGEANLRDRQMEKVIGK